METFDLSKVLLPILTGTVTAFFGWYLGKKKNDIEIALKYQEFYQKLTNDLKKEIDELSCKVENLITIDREKSKTIEDQEKTIKRFEANTLKLEQIIEKERKLNEKLCKQISKTK